MCVLCLYSKTQTSVFRHYFLFMWCGLLSIALQMETEEKDTKAVTSAAAACISLEKILQELNVLSDCMNQLACMHHCWVLYSRACRHQLHRWNGPLLIYLQICKAHDETVALDVRSDNPKWIIVHQLLLLGVSRRWDACQTWLCLWVERSNWTKRLRWLLVRQLTGRCEVGVALTYITNKNWQLSKMPMDKQHVQTDLSQIASAERCLPQFHLKACL